MKKQKLTEKDIQDIMSKYRDGIGLVEISKGYTYGQAVINGVICYYNHRKNKVSSLLSERYKKLIDEIRDVKEDPIVKTNVEYECRIFFGLITLRFKPVRNY